MKLFECPNCRHVLFFENLECTQCSTTLVYSREGQDFQPLIADGAACIHRNAIGCNWLAHINGGECDSCRLTDQPPPNLNEEATERFSKLEAAKRRLIYQLNRLGLSLEKQTQENPNGILFNFLPQDNQYGLLTGHANGVLTILLSEADSVKREQMRKQMSEPYRTILGHLRHEIGHYFWPLLFGDEELPKFREFFGDDKEDYGQALQAYYDRGAPPDWNAHFISEYASSHPWEDWAETWAHYLHLMDSMETAHSFGISIQSKIPGTLSSDGVNCPDPYRIQDFSQIAEAGVALTSAVNSLNRSMGIPDIYPFVIAPEVYGKLGFIHKLLSSRRPFV